MKAVSQETGLEFRITTLLTFGERLKYVIPTGLEIFARPYAQNAYPNLHQIIA
jgi:hypothetical protein